MMKRIFDRSAALSFVVIFFFVSLLFAQQPPPAEPPPNNTFTMTTYYPAPFGAYKKLTVSDSVGIGTSSPARAKLEILGSVGGTSAIFGPGSTGISLSGDGEYVGQYWPTIGFNTYSDGSFWRSISAGYTGAIDVNQTNGNMGFAILSHAASANESLISNHVIDITPSGNVGIGTTSPQWKLTVVNGESVNYTVGTDNHRRGVTEYWFGGDNGYTTINSYDWGPQGQSIGVGVQPLRIDGSILALNTWSAAGAGNVGIGTTGPNAPLDVFKSDSSATNNPGNPAIRVTATTGANSEFLSLGYDATLNRGYIQAAQAGVAWEDLLLNPKGGNIGIGTTTPGEKLEVSGNIKLSGATPTYKITNVAAPVANNDVATKAYVDAAAGGPGSWICQAVKNIGSGPAQTLISSCPAGYTLITGGCYGEQLGGAKNAPCDGDSCPPNGWYCNNYQSAVAWCCK